MTTLYVIGIFGVGMIVMYIISKLFNALNIDEEDDEENIDAVLAKNVLQVLKMGTHATTEREAIDYAIESIDIRTRVEQFIKEKEV